MKVTAPLLFVALTVFLSPRVSAQDAVRVGIIEFKIDNDIGLPRANQVIPEWLAAEFTKIGKYEVMERLSLGAIIREQDLSMTDYVDEKTAVEVGKLHGADGIVTGTVVKVGETIVVTGKIISVQSGKVLKSSVVKAAKLDNLPDEIQILANQLCDISKSQFEIKRDFTKRQSSYMGIGAGVSYGSDNKDYSSLGVSALISYTTQRYALQITGVPVGGFTNMSIGATYNVTPFWGIAAEAGFIGDNEIDYISVNYAALGIRVQPRHELSFNLLIGASTGATIWLWGSNDPGGAKEKVGGSFVPWPPMTFTVEAQYRMENHWAVAAKVLATGIEDFKLKRHVNFIGSSFESRVIWIMAIREFAIN